MKYKKFIACKRTKKSSWQYAEYSLSMDKSFDAIAPDVGNYLKIHLIDYEAYLTCMALCENMAHAAQKAKHQLICINAGHHLNACKACNAAKAIDKALDQYVSHKTMVNSNEL